ncbi:MarR family winged helix-turn-helix transcriptional regulator [Tistlia consotensis]|uniref:MarR family winged helix-turn-helix transcriptional regulator n=1 Tax=Tistlia consotensis TaxID=1321365 RepID=UPI001C52F577|nr:MarR family transcriptional regulator [Tistlia consotensis]
MAHLLRRAHQRASSIYLGLLSEHQLTPTQFFAMARLHEMGQISQNRLGRLAAMDPATIQGVIQRLAERGYIQRLQDSTDRRRMVLRLTSHGRTLIEPLIAEAERVNGSVLEPLEDQERELFVSLLRRLV